jgi:hypothetical protein
MVYVGLLNEWSNYDGCIHHSLSSYETLYQHTANALAAVNATLSGVPLLKIGGPNESNDEYTLNLFLSWCHDNSIPIGFVSYHLYRDNISDITSTVNTVQRYMKNYGYGNLPQLIGECGLHNSASTTYTASDLAKQAAFEAASWRAYMDTGLGEQVKPMIFAENGYDGLHNLSVLVPDEADRKEGQVFPRYNGYKMMSMMRSHRISSTSNNNGIYSIASSDSTGVAVLFINYSSSAQNAYINVNNLPSAFHSENIHYDRYLVDGTHSNYAYSQSNQGLQKVEDSSLSSGSSKSLTINMAAYATSLIVLTP